MELPFTSSMFLADASHRGSSTLITKFDARFWTTNFNRQMIATPHTRGSNSIHVDVMFHTEGDLAGLIWESEDKWDHVLLSYITNKNYRDTIFRFRWKSVGIAPLDHSNGGPLLTIEGRSSTGEPTIWYVRLYHKVETWFSNEEAIIALDFNNLGSGWFDDISVYVQDIDRMFFGLIPFGHIEGSTKPLPEPLAASITLSEMDISGPKLVLYHDIANNVLPMAVATGYDDNYNLTPERLVRSIKGLGYRKWINHYVGMSHYYLQNNNLKATMVDGKVLNTPTVNWHRNFFETARREGFEVIISHSYELLAENCPTEWMQYDVNGNPALTGWDPPSSLLPPTNKEAMNYTKQMAIEFCQLLHSAGLPVHYQIGEPWWWVHYQTWIPCFYDDATVSAYKTETGLEPPQIAIMTGPKTPVEQQFLDWLGVKLGDSTHMLKEAIKNVFPGAITYLLFYAPQVMDTNTPDLYRANRPISWKNPEFDILQLEDYDFVIAGNVAGSAAAAAAVTDILQYPVEKQHYFSGFVLKHEDAAALWPLIHEAALVAYRRGVPMGDVFYWAIPQVARDGFVMRLGSVVLKGGLYYIKPTTINDPAIDTYNEGQTRKIPDPTVRTGYFGG